MLAGGDRATGHRRGLRASWRNLSPSTASRRRSRSSRAMCGALCTSRGHRENHQPLGVRPSRGLRDSQPRWRSASRKRAPASATLAHPGGEVPLRRGGTVTSHAPASYPHRHGRWMEMRPCSPRRPGLSGFLLALGHTAASRRDDQSGMARIENHFRKC